MPVAEAEIKGCVASLALPKHSLLSFENVPCKFPFTYQGKEYHKCTKKDHDKEWCAMDMNNHLSHKDIKDCKECWKNETYKWGDCTCELGEKQNNNFKKFYALL